MLASKNPAAIAPLLRDRLVSVTVVPVPGSDSHPAEAFGPDARSADSVAEALRAIPPDRLPVLIAGSLYLAGEVLRLNCELPD
jgi:dihydrofolate synthase/folylpolyglutamate synthase